MKCPRCDDWMEQVTQPRDSPLNKEQWDSIKCGDYYCDSCRAYYWLKLERSSLQSMYSQRPPADHTTIDQPGIIVPATEKGHHDGQDS